MSKKLGVIKKTELTDRILIPKMHLKNVCKLGQSEKTCRYIGISVSGFYCAKNTTEKQKIDFYVKKGDFTAKGDNCDGFK